MSERKLYVGVDPGLSGAIAVIDQDRKVLYLKDMPTRKDVSKNTVDVLDLYWDEALREILSENPEVAIERVGAMPAGGTDTKPKQGIASTFAFGKSAGKIEGFFEAMGFVPLLITPSVWKRHFDLLKQEKKMGVYKAREMFPEVADKLIVSKDGRADALLLADYLRSKDVSSP